MLSELERTAKRSMLKWHAGHTMFCPGCEQVLDCKRVVEIDISKDGKLQASKIVCASCYDSRLKGNIEAQLHALGHTVEIIDGREIFGRKRTGVAR